MSTEQNARGSSSLGRRAAALLAGLGLAGSLLVVVAPVALATAGQDSVTGSVSYAPTGETITVAAITNSATTNAATGTWQDKAPTFTYSGAVTTLNVESKLTA